MAGTNTDGEGLELELVRLNWAVLAEVEMPDVDVVMNDEGGPDTEMEEVEDCGDEAASVEDGVPDTSVSIVHFRYGERGIGRRRTRFGSTT